MLPPLFSFLALPAFLGLTRPMPAVRADSDTAQLPLTVEALSNMATFWTTFLKEPSSVKDEGRKANHKPLSLSVPMNKNGTVENKDVALPGVVDMNAMVKEFPSVATDLTQAHLTAPKWEQYRQSLFTAKLADQFDRDAKQDVKQDAGQGASAPSVPAVAQSVVWQNVAFLRTHQKELDALAATGMWFPKVATPHNPLVIGQAAPQLAVNHWVNDSLGRGSHTTFGDGHIYVLDLTAHWCGPCRMVYPALTPLKAKYAAQDVRFIYGTMLFGNYKSQESVGMTPAAEVDSLKQYIVEHHLMSSMFVTEAKELLKFYDTGIVFPRLVVIDGAGKVQYLNEGWSSSIPQELDAKLQELTSAAASASHKGS